MNYKNIFLVGIKGAAMANIALIAKKMGMRVHGSDKSEEFITDEQLHKNNITVINTFEANALPHDIDLVIYSAAHGGIQNLQVVEAKNRGIIIKHQAEFLGEILREFTNSIAVCGTHGKTTTSAMLSYCLLKLGVQPSYLVGTSGFNGHYGGEYNNKDYFVIEADEYGLNPPSDITPKFQFLHPTHCLATNIDFDHPDVYTDIQATKNAFLKFFHQITAEKSHQLYVCIDDQDLMSVIEKLPKITYKTFGYASEANIQIVNPVVSENKTTFELIYKGDNLGIFSLSVFGGKHISNAAGVVLVLLDLGFKVSEIKKAIEGFTGAKRRFELVKKIQSFYLFDDYAHHPEEIRSTLETAKKRFKKRRLVVIFQPHTFSRTYALKDQFVDALSIADFVYIAPIFASAREKSAEFDVCSDDLVKAAREKSMNHFYAYISNDDLMSHLAGFLRDDDVLFTMGAGDIYKMKNDIISLMMKLK